MLEALKQVDILTSVILSLGGALIAIFIWWERRNRQYTDTQVSSVVMGQGQTHERLTRLEDRVDEVEEEVLKVAERIGRAEGVMATLATAHQVADLRDRMGTMEGTLLQVSGAVDIIYRAALRGDGGAP
jgi:hypothetical protein